MIITFLYFAISACTSSEAGMKALSERFPQAFKDSKPIVVDFTLSGCGPCQELKPKLKALQNEYDGRVHVLYVDAAEHRDLIDMFKIKYFPTIKFFRNNRLENHELSPYQDRITSIRQIVDKMLRELTLNSRFLESKPIQGQLNTLKTPENPEKHGLKVKVLEICDDGKCKLEYVVLPAHLGGPKNEQELKNPNYFLTLKSRFLESEPIKGKLNNINTPNNPEIDGYEVKVLEICDGGKCKLEYTVLPIHLGGPSKKPEFQPASRASSSTFAHDSPESLAQNSIQKGSLCHFSNGKSGKVVEILDNERVVVEFVQERREEAMKSVKTVAVNELMMCTGNMCIPINQNNKEDLRKEKSGTTLKLMRDETEVKFIQFEGDDRVIVELL